MVLSGRFIGSSLLLAALAAAGGCASGGNGASPAAAASPDQAVSGKADTPACNLRAALDSLMVEHVDLALAASDAAVAGRNDEFTAAKNALDSNTAEIGNVFGQALGSTDDAKTLTDLWNSNTGYIVDYTAAVVAGDKDKQDAAVNNLIGNAKDIGAFFENATNGGLKKDAVSGWLVTDVTAIKDVIDAQASKDYAGAYSKERDAANQMEQVATDLADSIADEYPDRF